MAKRDALGIDRFTDPLYTVAETACYLGEADSTVRSWARGYRRRGRGDVTDASGSPVLTAVMPSGTRGPAIPFVGLAEGLVLAAMRRSGVPLQRIRPALTRLEEQIGVAHALASKRLYTDGAEVLFDFAESRPEDEAARTARDLVVVRNGQRVFNDVVQSYLRLDSKMRWPCCERVSRWTWSQRNTASREINSRTPSGSPLSSLPD